MKPLLISFVVALILIGTAECISEEMKAKIMEIQKECMSESGISEVVLRKAMEGDELTAEMQVNMKHHAFCFAKKLGVMNDDGTFNTEVLKKLLTAALQDEGKADTLVTTCARVEATPQDSALSAFRCMITAIKN